MYYPFKDLEVLTAKLATYDEEIKIGFTCSCFDLLHAGHIIMLEDAKRQCDVLVIGLQTDPTIDEEYRLNTKGEIKNKPVQPFEERLIQIKACRYVDHVIEYSTEKDLLKLLTELNIDVRILGSDWKRKKYTGHELTTKIYWHKRKHGYSTSALRRKVYQQELLKQKT